VDREATRIQPRALIATVCVELPDHAPPDAGNAPEYTLYRLEGAATFREWVETIAAQWSRHVRGQSTAMTSISTSEFPGMPPAAAIVVRTGGSGPNRPWNISFIPA